MNYKFYFGYTNAIGKREEIRKSYLPLDSFSVVGGADRTIQLKSASDISITSELEQARAYKNITLFMSSEQNPLAMEAAVELITVAREKKEIVISVVAQRLAKGQVVEEVSLSDFKATIRRSPVVAENKRLMIEVNLPAATIYTGKLRDGRYYDIVKM